MNQLIALFLVGVFCLSATVQANEKADVDSALNQLFKQLEITQGVANFTQKKYFAFLSTPITSQGTLKVHKGSIIWQVEKPVFSKLMIVQDQVWQLKSEKDKSPARYQQRVSHAGVETLIRAIFTGKVSPSKWKITLENALCLQLVPNDSLLLQAISSLSLCLTENKKQRHVIINDAQNNRTEIEINITAYSLLDDDIREFNLNK